MELARQRRQGDVEAGVADDDDHQAEAQHAERPPALVVQAFDVAQGGCLHWSSGRLGGGGSGGTAVRHTNLCARKNPIPCERLNSHQPRGTSLHGRSLSTRGSGGSPSTRSPTMLRWISVVPPSMGLARGRRKNWRAERGGPT